jgi:hypothetical protein
VTHCRPASRHAREVSCALTLTKFEFCGWTVIAGGWQMLTVAVAEFVVAPHDPVARTQLVVDEGEMVRLALVPPVTGEAVLPFAPAYQR